MRCAAAIVAVAACTPPVAARHIVIATAAPSAYPAELAPPAALHPDFSVRQTLAIHASDARGRPIDAHVDAVLQKHGDTLLVVGLGPMSTKAFTLAQHGDTIAFDQFVGPPLPFSPRNIIVDIHRVYFMRLPPPPPRFSGVQQGELHGEHVVETWQSGMLRAIAFTRPALRGEVRVEFGDGCAIAGCRPAHVRVHNDWFGYTLVIDSADYEDL